MSSEKIKIKLDLNDPEQYRIVELFAKLHGFQYIIEDIAQRRAEIEPKVWKLVEQKFPEVEGKVMTYAHTERTLSEMEIETDD